MIFIVIAALVIAALIWAVSTGNGFKRREIQLAESLSGIEVALTKRYDMLTKLLDTAKGYAAHETQVFTQVIQLRRGMSTGELEDAARQMDGLSSKVFALAENYPELRSSEVFAQLQHGIRDSEEHLQAARRLHNSNVRQYNTAIAIFPASLLAKGRTPYPFFQAEEYKQADVSMKF